MKILLKKHIEAFLIVILITAIGLTSCCSKTQEERIKKAREGYSFVINNDRFVGEQSDQEMGDYQICFYGDIEAFTGLTVGKGVDDDVWKEWLQVTDDSVTVFDAENHIAVEEYQHNLKFKDYISVNIIAGLDGKAEMEILTNGGYFSREKVNWIGRNGRIFAEASGGNTVLNNCTLSYFCNGWDKSIWLYGDSYFSMNEPDRWTTYLIKNGASDILLSGHSGEGSVESLEAFKTQLKYGTPKTVIWCVGMNDGDEINEINQSYKECLDEIIKLCVDGNIELILATIPTCPHWFNDHKNDYVKGLGYRFIDFADAVGSHESITWRETMLEEGENRIHPTVNGALALYGKAVSEVPELLKHK